MTTKMLITVILLFSCILRFHNAFAYNPLWGYDGGAHLAYLDVLREHHRLPTQAETYLAWHEPLYYILASLTSLPAGEAGGAGLRIFQAALGVLFVVAVGWLAYTITRRQAVALITMMFVAVLPPAVLISAYPTNELLAQVLFVVILCVTIPHLIPPPAPQGEENKRTFLPLAAQGGGWVGDPIKIGLLLAVAQWTKLSAVLVVAAVVVAYCNILFCHPDPDVASGEGSPKSFLRFFTAFRMTILKKIVVVLGVWFLLSLPWHLYRQTHLGGAWRINNVERAAAGASHPLKFYLWFNKDVLFRPFWSTASNSLWSVLYAQTFADYDILLENPDKTAALPSNATTLTDTGRYVSLTHATANVVLSRYSLALVALGVFGLIVLYRRRRDPAHFLLLTFFTISIAALIYNASRYPYLDRGTLKPIFILAALPLPLIAASDAILRRSSRYGLLFLGGIMALFILFALPVVWIS